MSESDTKPIVIRLKTETFECDKYDPDGYPSSPGSAHERKYDPKSGRATASTTKRKRAHSFERNPSTRNRHRKRLLKKLRNVLDELTTCTGQQAIVLIATPGAADEEAYEVFGTKPLEDVVDGFRSMIIDEVRERLERSPPPALDRHPSFELPPLVVDGVPTPVEKMTQAQLRAFIPSMLRYSTGRGKPGWGRKSTRPPWWPDELPWANVRIDARTREEKRLSWTDALRRIVVNCYEYHCREDLLSAPVEEDAETTTSEEDTAPVPKRDDTCRSRTATRSNGTLRVVPTGLLVALPDGTRAQVHEITAVRRDHVEPKIETSSVALGTETAFDPIDDVLF